MTGAVGAEVIEIVDGKIKEVLDYQSPTVGQGRVATSQARSVSGQHQRTHGFGMTQMVDSYELCHVDRRYALTVHARRTQAFGELLVRGFGAV